MIANVPPLRPDRSPKRDVLASFKASVSLIRTARLLLRAVVSAKGDVASLFIDDGESRGHDADLFADVVKGRAADVSSCRDVGFFKRGDVFLSEDDVSLLPGGVSFFPEDVDERGDDGQ